MYLWAYFDKFSISTKLSSRMLIIQTWWIN